VRRAAVIFAALVLLATPARADDALAAKVAELLRHAAATRDHDQHVTDLRELEGLARLDSSVAVPLAPLLGLLEDPEERCRAAALSVLVATHARRPGGLGDATTEAAARIVPLAASQRRLVREQARAYLETLTGERRTLLEWTAWREGRGEPVRLSEIVAYVSSGSVNGVPVPDVAAAVQALEVRANVAGVPFSESRDFRPAATDECTEPAWELAPPIPFDEWARRAEVLLADHSEKVACDRDEASARIARIDLIAHALRHDGSVRGDALFRGLEERRGRISHHAALHEIVKERLTVTAVVVDRRAGSKAIVVYDEDSSETRGRIYSEGDVLRDRDNRAVGGLVIEKIKEGGIELSLDGERVEKELKQAN
jgi:hypothetical protein